MSQKQAILVVGAGDGTGGAVARRFAREGYIACILRRNAEKLQPLIDSIEAIGGVVYPFAGDASQEADIVRVVAAIERDIAPVEVAVFNIGANYRFSITDSSQRFLGGLAARLLCWFSDGSRGRENDDRAGTRDYHFYWRDCQPSWARRVRRFRKRKARTTCSRAKYGARALAKRYPRCPYRHRRPDRWPIHSYQFSRAIRLKRTGRCSLPRQHR